MTHICVPKEWLSWRICRNEVDAWKTETGYGFSLYSTPSENLCDRFCRLDAAAFGVVHGVTDKGYYTKSFHLDVEKKVNPYDKIDFEAPYPAIANGGFICYGEYPNIQHNLKVLEDVWDYSYDRVPYYGTNTPIDECYDCGFSGNSAAPEKALPVPVLRQSQSGLDSGVLFTLAMEEQLIADLKDRRIPRQGLSLSGGDPLHPHNVPHSLK